MRAKYEIKTDFLGPRDTHAKQLRILNRVISWEDDGIMYESDQRHAEIIIKSMDVQKAVATPGSRDDAGKADRPNVTSETPTERPNAYASVDALASLPSTSTSTGRQGRPGYHGAAAAGGAEVETEPSSKAVGKLGGAEVHPMHTEASNAPSPLQVDFDDDSDQSPLLGKTESSLYRALAARANYLAQDRPDVQFAVKEIARRMATPRANDWQLLKRLARYLLGAPRGILKYCWQSRPSVADGYVDADWAGCKRTCRSTQVP